MCVATTHTSSTTTTTTSSSSMRHTQHKRHWLMCSGSHTLQLLLRLLTLRAPVRLVCCWWYVCVCECVCVRACVRVCECVNVCASVRIAHASAHSVHVSQTPTIAHTCEQVCASVCARVRARANAPQMNTECIHEEAIKLICAACFHSLTNGLLGVIP